MSRRFIEPQILVNTPDGLERISLDEALNLQVNKEPHIKDKEIQDLYLEIRKIIASEVKKMKEDV